jgi:hypothetical protein
MDMDTTNKPVAWGWYDLEIKKFFPHWDEDLMENKEGCIPLYTHPVKELTDEEILSVIKCVADDVSPHKEYENNYADGWLDACNTVYDEVFAILKKAQEK